MPWEKSSPELVERFSAAVPEAPDVVRKSMFGYPSAVVNGHMFMGLHQENMVLRLGAADLEEFRAAGATDFEPMPGRPMTGFGVVPPAILADPARLASWVERAVADVRSRPPKVAKARRPAAPKAGRRG